MVEVAHERSVRKDILHMCGVVLRCYRRCTQGESRIRDQVCAGGLGVDSERGGAHMWSGASRTVLLGS
jgi:hypothetical protein